MISTVRSNEENATGFVRDWRRINVAMTRAKCQPQRLRICENMWEPTSKLQNLRYELGISQVRAIGGLQSIDIGPRSYLLAPWLMPKYLKWTTCRIWPYISTDFNRFALGSLASGFHGFTGRSGAVFGDFGQHKLYFFCEAKATKLLIGKQQLLRCKWSTLHICLVHCNMYILFHTLYITFLRSRCKV